MIDLQHPSVIHFKHNLFLAETPICEQISNRFICFSHDFSLAPESHHFENIANGGKKQSMNVIWFFAKRLHINILVCQSSFRTDAKPLSLDVVGLRPLFTLMSCCSINHNSVFLWLCTLLRYFCCLSTKQDKWSGRVPWPLEGKEENAACSPSENKKKEKKAAER